MSARSRMTMRAILQTPTTVTDDFGQEGPPTWATTGDPVACYAWTRVKREANDANKIAVVEDFRAIVPRGTPINDEYRFLKIQDRLGNQIFPGPIMIETIQIYADHLELALRRVDSGANVQL